MREQPTDRDPTKLRDLGQFTSGRLGDLLAKAVEIELPMSQRVAQWRSEGR